MGTISKKDKVCEIITDALKNFNHNGMKDITRIVINKGYFITSLPVELIPSRIKGNVIIIDLTRSPQFEPDEFFNHSKYLLNKIIKIPYWYGC